MPLPLAIPLISAGTTLFGGAFSFFGGKNQQKSQNEMMQKQLDAQFQMQQAQLSADERRAKELQKVLLYVGIVITFIILLVIINRSI
jgi:hypothetical protein